MNLEFKKPLAEDMMKLAPYFSLRPNRTCDSGFLDIYLWSEHYNVKYCLVDDKAIIWSMEDNGECFSAMPLCREEDLKTYFELSKKYFNEVLKKPYKIYLADEEGVEYLKLKENPDYIVKEEFDLKDYLYDAEELRTLPGKKFHKKKNLVNKFKREYEGRWEYRSMSCDSKQLVWDFLDRWYAQRSKEVKDGEESLESEVKGIHEILKNCCSLSFKMGGIFVDNVLQAFSIGSYNPREKMAIIDIEKGNSEFSGIYQMINQQFLQHEFPEAVLVNREDDVGLEGLRKAKQSYNPIDYARKYMVLQKNFEGYESELQDQYEEAIRKYGQVNENVYSSAGQI